MKLQRRSLKNTHTINALSRRGFISCTAVVAAVAMATPAHALSRESLLARGRIPLRAGVTDWATLEKVNFNGFTKPASLAPEATALVGQTIKLEGYILAFEEGESTNEFMLSAYNTHCPFCSPGTMASLVTIHTKNPIALKPGTLTVSGTLEVDKSDLSGMIYHLINATVG